MAPRGRLNALAARKRLILARADLHRQLLAVEGDRLQGRWDSAQSFVTRNRWWLIGGAVAGGALLTRGWRGLLSLTPTLFSVVRSALLR